MESVAVTPQSVIPTISKPSTPSVESKVEVKEVNNDSTLQNSVDIKTDNEQLAPKEVVSEFNKISSELNLDVEFDYNKKIGEFTISVTNKETGEIIRKLPTEEAIKIKENMKDLVGVLFDKKG